MKKKPALVTLGGLMLSVGLISFLAPRSTAEEGAPAGRDSSAAMALPQYNDAGELLRPEGYERWTLVGTSLGLDYLPGQDRDPARPGVFHNVYMQPQAFDHYVRTGEWAEQTVFVVTNNPAMRRQGEDEINRQGTFAAPTQGLEVSVRDTRRFDDGWGYFLFAANDRGRAACKPLPTKDCFECHAQHGADNGVFVQFYSVLRSARQRQLDKPAGE
ncbi:MAG: cytochrome P460 family protein [Pirellulales bacterium]|nr:cytochrome P460 family protein [Pirellulales bacterium]